MEEMLNVFSVPIIAAIVYWLVNLVKYTTKYNEKVLTFIPLIATVLGIICGITAFFVAPETMPTQSAVVASVIGGASGMSAVGFNQIIKQIEKSNSDGDKRK
jgi:flagellar biosynthesis protein FliQ